MTTHVAPQAKDWYSAKETDVGYQKVIGYLPAAHGLTLAQNDTVQMVKVPIGSIVTDAVVMSGDLTNNATIAVGDLGVTNRYISATNHGAGSAVITNMNQPQAGVPYTYTADDTIDILLAAGNPADNVAIALIIGYLTGLDITP